MKYIIFGGIFFSFLFIFFLLIKNDNDNEKNKRMGEMKERIKKVSDKIKKK